MVNTHVVHIFNPRHECGDSRKTYLYKNKQGISDTRPTNAVKLMSNFVAKPFTTWGTLWKQLMPYLKSANGAPWFQNSVDEVMALFKEGDFEDNRALSPLFLLGYSCQRRESMRKAQEASQKSKEN